MAINDAKKKINDQGNEFKDAKETSESIIEIRERQMREMNDIALPDSDLFADRDRAIGEIKSEARSDHADRVSKVNNDLQKAAQDVRQDVASDAKDTDTARTKMERAASEGTYGIGALRDASSKAEQRSREYSDLSKQSESDSNDAKRVVESDARKLQS